MEAVSVVQKIVEDSGLKCENSICSSQGNDPDIEIDG